MTRDSLFAFLNRLADAAAAASLPYFRAAPSVEDKGGTRFDPVTRADREAEAAMRTLIEDAFPEDGVIGEELGTLRGDAHRVWVLDPIDGTRSFLTGVPLWGTLVGLLEAGRPVAGLMHQPYTGERYLSDGRGTMLIERTGTRSLATRTCASLAEATLMTTSPHLFAPGENRAYERVEGAVRLARYGADCYAYAQVAAGNVDLVVEAGLAPYDIVALIPIVEGAGGIVTGWDGGSAARGGRIVAAGDARLHAAALELLNA